MQIFNLYVIAFLIFFYSSGLGQSEQSLDSTKVKKDSGIIFQKESEYRLQDSSYTDVIQLFGLAATAQAIQFRILINKSSDDNNILIFKDIQKGSDINDPGWLLDFNVIKGQVSTNGASQDEISILLYYSNLDGGLVPGDHSDLIQIKYKVAHIGDLNNYIKSSMQISHAEASTFEGNAINITSTRNELKIYVNGK